MYVISAYEIIDICSERYLLNFTIGAKISSHSLQQILLELNQQEKREITEKKLLEIALQYEVDIKELKQLLISKLHILKPLLSRKIPAIYLNCDDDLVDKLLGDTLKPEYNVHYCASLDPADKPWDVAMANNGKRFRCIKDFLGLQTPSLLIYYRQNYSDSDFKQIYQALPDNVYLITCGVLHHQLVIDNIYFNHSGLPTHFSNFHQLMIDSASDENYPDRLSFYRSLYQRQIDIFPVLSLSPCQRGYIAYSIHQFLARFIQFEGQPIPHDAINWRWQVDLLKFGVQKEVAVMEEAECL